MDGCMCREDCLTILRNTAYRENRLPKKSDFSVEEVARIKAFYGPWPRALEAAGLLTGNAEARAARKLEKRIRAKVRKRNYNLAQRQLRPGD